MTLRLDRSAILGGALVAMAVAVPVIVGAELLDALIDLDAESNLLLLFYAAVLAGLVLGGRAGGLRQPEAPLVHGALASLAAYAVLALLTTAVRLAGGEVLDPVAVVFNALMAASAGTLGGLLAARRLARPAS